MAGIVVQCNLLYDFLCCMHFGFMNNIYLSYIFSQTNNGDSQSCPIGTILICIHDQCIRAARR